MDLESGETLVWEVFSGGLTNRLRVELASGDEELFVVRKVEDVAKELSEAAAMREDN